MGFQWVALNGCAICMALQGFYEEEPVRPHPNCDCEIFDEHAGLPPGNCWPEIANWTGEVDTGAEPWIVTFTCTVKKICQDGAEVEEDLDMEWPFDDWVDAFGGENGPAYDAWHDELHHRIDAMCEGILEDKCTEFSIPAPDHPTPEP